jgi:hypothetical protein
MNMAGPLRPTVLTGASIILRLPTPQEFTNDLIVDVFQALGVDVIDRLHRLDIIVVDDNGIERMHGVIDRDHGPNKHRVGKPSYAEEAKLQAIAFEERRRAQPEIERALDA